MDLKAKFRLTIGVAALGLLVLSGVWVHSEHARILAEKEEQAKNLVAIPYSIISQQYQLERQGRITREQAQASAIALLRDVRYGEGNYFWINDMHPRMVMHPTQPELEGVDLTKYKDPQGERLFMAAIQAVQDNGEGFLHYRWPKPGHGTKPVPKISFVREFEPWGWIIGTGVYVDDVDALWRANAVTAATVTIACIVVLLIVSAALLRSIFSRLNLVVDQMKGIVTAEGHFPGAVCPFPIEDRGTHDQVSVLMSGFNEMLNAIRKRDEQLRRHGEELERQVEARTAQLQRANSELVDAHGEIELFLRCIPSILIGLDLTGHIVRWNQSASKNFGVTDEQAVGQTLTTCGIKWLQPDIEKLISSWMDADAILRCENITYERDGDIRFLGVSVRPILSKANEKMGFIVTGADTTERKTLEAQLMQAHKLEAVGQLAAGIAHEINTPTQYVSDNTTFLKDSCGPLIELLTVCAALRRELEEGPVSKESLTRFDQLVEQADLPYLEKEIPKAIEQSLDGLQRIANIVKAMKEFSHPGSSEKAAIDINRAIQTTITVARNEWKYVAELNTEFDQGLPPVPCVQGEFQQVILNLLVNAAQALQAVVGDGTSGKGRITVTTRRKGESVEIAIHDNGPGIPPQIRSRVFEPFFTTKPVGKGTGQGLSLAHSTIVKRHQGRIWFETEVGKGTTFFLQLPLQATRAASV